MGHCFEITLWLPFGHEDEHEVPYGENRNLDLFARFRSSFDSKENSTMEKNRVTCP
jgi:hypothetical protein